ncbi:hypothetical protein L2E82_32992 [Cichorium intybus]|uniref:Uncharacterized protein n=1 Tax=Cichorium intybus TaxID=13427 RepID=A0ACB9BIB0_CICIN|nr:hypothetical protein L2E82_32992 [Cichorium intybus]
MLEIVQLPSLFLAITTTDYINPQLSSHKLAHITVIDHLIKPNGPLSGDSPILILKWEVRMVVMSGWIVAKKSEIIFKKDEGGILDDKQFFVNHPNAYPIATAQVAEEVNFATNRIILEILISFGP